MSKDNIIQFPTTHKPSRKTKVDILNNRLKELQVENDYLQADMDYLADTVDGNIEEMQIILKELEKLHLATLKQSVTELKDDFGVDLTTIVDNLIVDTTKPKDKE